MSSGDFDGTLVYKDNGLIAAVIQHYETGEVLMVGYMNEEAVQRTRDSGTVWFWSRSRQEMWHKGDTSGNVLYVKSLATDCDGDALVVKADPVGPTCHTGANSCFHNPLPAAVGAR
jgi:phosphoribosyl-AMP cyclohydrolase